MNNCKIYSLVIALVLLVPCLALALPGAHDPASGNDMRVILAIFHLHHTGIPTQITQQMFVCGVTL